MKIIGIEDNEKQEEKLNKRKKLFTIGIIIIAVLIIIVGSLYVANMEFRNFIDFKILRKEVTSEDATVISIDENQRNIFGYDKYLVVLKDNKLIHYLSSGKKGSEIEVQISNPVVDINGNYLIIAEKEKQKLYLISNGNKIWEKNEKDIEGNIIRVSVNKNGYSAIILSGTTHKSVIEIFDNNGKKIFKTYLSNTLAIDVDISFDNKYMSFAEVNTNGTKVSSDIKTISIEEAKVINTYEVKQDAIILNIKYQEQNRLVCMYDKKTCMIKDSKEEDYLTEEEVSKSTFLDIELLNNIVKITDKSSIFKARNDIEIINTTNKATSLYLLDGVVKGLYCYDSKIALNLGTEVQFIGSNGWLIKKYTSNQEVKDVVICNDFAGVIYRNRIDIVKL